MLGFLLQSLQYMRIAMETVSRVVGCITKQRSVLLPAFVVVDLFTSLLEAFKIGSAYFTECAYSLLALLYFLKNRVILQLIHAL